MKDGRERLELNKILAQVAAYAVLEESKQNLLSLEPTRDLTEGKRRLDYTEEAERLLFTLGAGRVEYFPPLYDLPRQAQKGASLTCSELIDCAKLLRSARVCARSILSFNDEQIENMRELALRLVADENLEGEINEKIIGENEISDRASEKLFTLRRDIRLLGERIRARLAAYLTGEEKGFLQDSLVTVRGDRYVIPVKAEYKRSIKGFVHDRSQSGATVFIEPEEVLEMNNELRSLTLDEKEEEARILAELSRAVGMRRSEIESDIALLVEIDCHYARAEYAYAVKGIKPQLNGKGIVEIEKGRHPLLDSKTVVPVSVAVGENYRFLLISGANAGGKTVTLKMCGLFCLMAACGLFVPAVRARLAVFNEVFCDIGDSQSIEENLSTFSSHLVNINEILRSAKENAFVLIDEPGGGTDPEEGQALARAVLTTLLRQGAHGIFTTHYSALKEFAYEAQGVENGCMEFDAQDFRPLYRLKIGMPGSSNALAVCRRLGLPQEVIDEAKGYLSAGAQAFDNTVRAAEESRIKAEEVQIEAEKLRASWQEKLATLEREEKQFAKEREKFLLTAKAEARRVVNERTARAEELLEEIEEIFKQDTLTESDLIRARTLKNKMGEAMPVEEEKVRLSPVEPSLLKAGDSVFVGSMGATGKILSIRQGKDADVQVGSLKVRCKFHDLFTSPKKVEQKEDVRVIKSLNERPMPQVECNVIGLAVDEALPEVEAFLDSALVSNLSTVRIVHGMGKGILRTAIHNLLRKNKRVAEYRLGKYGEGESGVTIVTFK